MEELKCPICGKPTRIYMGNARKDKLCGYHADLLKSGEITVDDKGLFRDKDHKVLNANYVEEEKTQESIVVKCIACGRETFNGNLFCAPCYFKYKDKKLLVSISKCRDIEIMDESYEGMYKCKDGHIVKSKSEKDIDNYLFDHGIPHAYEKTISIDANKEHDLHPDFFLPNFKNSGKDVYIEHWGFNSNNREYTKSKKYKIKKYEELGLTIISTNEKDITDTEAALERKLNHFEYGKINFADEE